MIHSLSSIFLNRSIFEPFGIFSERYYSLNNKNDDITLINHFDSIPNNIILNIMNYLSVDDILSFRLAYKAIINLSKDEIFWRKRLNNDFFINNKKSCFRLYLSIYKKTLLTHDAEIIYGFKRNRMRNIKINNYFAKTKINTGRINKQFLDNYYVSLVNKEIIPLFRGLSKYIIYYSDKNFNPIALGIIRNNNVVTIDNNFISNYFVINNTPINNKSINNKYINILNYNITHIYIISNDRVFYDFCKGLAMISYGINAGDCDTQNFFEVGGLGYYANIYSKLMNSVRDMLDGFGFSHDHTHNIIKHIDINIRYRD